MIWRSSLHRNPAREKQQGSERELAFVICKPKGLPISIFTRCARPFQIRQNCGPIIWILLKDLPKTLSLRESDFGILQAPKKRSKFLRFSARPHLEHNQQLSCKCKNVWRDKANLFSTLKRKKIYYSKNVSKNGANNRKIRRFVHLNFRSIPDFRFLSRFHVQLLIFL